MDMIKDYCGSYYGSYRQKKFSDVYSSSDEFLADYKGIGLPTTIADSSAQTLYYLLYGRYGNDIVASSDLTRFKYAMFSIVFQYGPNWEKQLEIQEKLRGLTEKEITTGGMQVYNTADNPSTEPSTDTDEELAYINAQNVTKSKRSKLDGYGTLLLLLKTDVTQDFINKFKKLFLSVVEPENDLYYVTEED